MNANSSPPRCNAFLEEVDHLTHELTQIRTIVSDATASLARGFSTIDAQSRQQQAVLKGSVNLVQSHGVDGPVSRFVSHSTTIVSRAHQSLEHTADGVQKLTRAIEGVSKVLAKVAKITASIRSYAEQARILSLNASIQSTRAGEVGLGFRVVAEAMQELAMEFARLSREAEQVVGDVRDTLQQTSAESAATSEIARVAVDQGQRSVEELDGAAQVLETELNGSLREAQELQQLVSVGVGECIRALQFDDLVSQLADLSMRRVDALRPLASLFELDGPFSERAGTALESFDNQRAGLRQVVHQSDVSEGDVELF